MRKSKRLHRRVRKGVINGRGRREYGGEVAVESAGVGSGRCATVVVEAEKIMLMSGRGFERKKRKSAWLLLRR